MKLARWRQITLTQILPVERVRTGCFISRVYCLVTTSKLKSIQTATTTNPDLLEIGNDNGDGWAALVEKRTGSDRWRSQ